MHMRVRMASGRALPVPVQKMTTHGFKLTEPVDDALLSPLYVCVSPVLKC